MRSTSVFALLFLCAPFAAGCSGAGQSTGSLPMASTSGSTTASGSSVATSGSTALAQSVRTASLTSVSGAGISVSPGSNSGCAHFLANPMCHTLPANPSVSQYSAAWAALDFQAGRAYMPSFSAKPGPNPFKETQDNSDPPFGEVQPGGSSISATITCDADSWSGYVCDSHHIGGKTIRVPANMMPAGNSDHHYSFNDIAGQQEYDFWEVQNMPTGGKLHMGGGGVCKWSGDGTGCSGSVAANIAGSLGSITASDFQRAYAGGWHGSFGHAIAFTALCNDTTYVYPATASDGSNSNTRSACSGHTGAHARPPEGTRLFLDMSDDQVNALKLPAYNRAWLRTLDREHEGGTITDTSWSQAPGISAKYQRDDFSAQALQAGITPSAYAAVPINLGTINLARDIKFCSNGTC